MITYGNGEVIGLENIQGFDIKYNGSIEIDPAQDNWIIQANKNRIIGICLNTTSSALLFTYTGELRILSAKYVQNNEQHRSRITLQGVDYWELDREKWEDDGSLWGTRNGTYLVGSKKRKTTVKNLENGVSKVPVHDMPSQSLPNHIVPPPFSNTYSLNFDGTNDYVGSLGMGDAYGSGAMSISCWFKCADVSSSTIQFIWGEGHYTLPNKFGFGLGILSSNLRGAAGNNSTSVWDNLNYSISSDTWYHAVLVYDKDNGDTNDHFYRLYVDGVLRDSYDTDNTPRFSGSFESYLIGCSGDDDASPNYNKFFNGNIDEVAIWNTALDADAITAIYNSGKPTNLNSDSGDYDNSSNLQGYWRMGDGDTYPTITDNSSNSNDGTMTNMVSGDIEEDTP